MYSESSFARDMKLVIWEWKKVQNWLKRNVNYLVLLLGCSWAESCSLTLTDESLFPRENGGEIPASGLHAKPDRSTDIKPLTSLNSIRNLQLHSLNVNYRSHQTYLRVIKHWIFHDGNVPIRLGGINNDGPPDAPPLWSPHFGLYFTLYDALLLHCGNSAWAAGKISEMEKMKWRNTKYFDRFETGARAKDRKDGHE